MPKQICIVDNMTGPRRMMRFALSMQGMQVVEAEDDAEAFDVMARQRVDMFIVDMRIPSAGGLDMVRRLRRTKEGAMLPVALVCGRDDLEARQEARDLDGIIWLKRPFRISDIEQAVTLGLNATVSAEPNAVSNG